MSKYADELAKTYGTVGNIKRLTYEKKEQEKISKRLKQASDNITLMTAGKLKRKI